MPPSTRSSTAKMTQPAATRKSKQQASVVDNWSAPEPPSTEPSSPHTPGPSPKKRARRTNSDPKSTTLPVERVRNKRGKLKELMNMTPEIFVEIAAHLYPVDLVHLSRANKCFRKLLMSRLMIDVWQSAERNVKGLPPCPKELCEPQYAALVFIKSCSLCGGQALRPMDPVLQLRLCIRCREEQTVLVKKVTDASLVFKSEIPTQSRWPEMWCLLNDARAVKTKLNELRKGDYEEYNRWVQERRQLVWKRYQDAQPLVGFLKKMRHDHNAELRDIRREREAEIKTRLLKLGYEKLDIECSDSDWKQFWIATTRRTKPLTERAWNELLPALAKHIEQNYARRLESEVR